MACSAERGLFLDLGDPSLENSGTRSCPLHWNERERWLFLYLSNVRFICVACGAQRISLYEYSDIHFICVACKVGRQRNTWRGFWLRYEMVFYPSYIFIFFPFLFLLTKTSLCSIFDQIVLYTLPRWRWIKRCAHWVCHWILIDGKNCQSSLVSPHQRGKESIQDWVESPQSGRDLDATFLMKWIWTR